MKKIISFLLSVMILMGMFSLNLSVSAETKTKVITNASVGSNMSSVNYTVTAGDYETDGYISKLTTSKFTNISETDKAIYVKIPSSIWTYNPTAITIKVKIADSDEYSAGQAIARFTNLSSFSSWNPNANDVNLLSGDGKWYTIAGGVEKTIRCDLTSERFAPVKERKMTKLLFPNGARTNCRVTEFTLTSFEIEYEEDGLTTDALSTKAEASIRLNDQTGIRFYTTFDESAIEGTVVEKGTLIGPSDLVGTYLKMDDVEADNAVAVKYEADTLWANNEFVGSIVGINESNYNRSFTARAYVKLSDGTYLYSATTTTKTVADIADAYIADENANPKYADLDANTKALVDAWAAAND